MKYLALLLTFFLFSLVVFAQVDFNVPDDEFVSDVQWIIAPKDSVFYVIFETDDRVTRIKFARSLYYKPRDFLILSPDENVFFMLDELTHYSLRGYPTIFKFKEE